MQRLFPSLAVVFLACSTWALPAQAQCEGSEAYNQGLRLNNAGKYREAIPYLTKAVEMDGEIPTLTANAGRLASNSASMTRPSPTTMLS